MFTERTKVADSHHQVAGLERWPSQLFYVSIHAVSELSTRVWCGGAGEVIDVIVQNNAANAFNGDYRLAVLLRARKLSRVADAGNHSHTLRWARRPNNGRTAAEQVTDTARQAPGSR